MEELWTGLLTHPLYAKFLDLNTTLSHHQFEYLVACGMGSLGG